MEPQSTTAHAAPKNEYAFVVYVITHIPTGRQYVGRTNHMRKRWNSHRSSLNRGIHTSPQLQEDWVRDGETVFTVAILEALESIEALMDAEDKWRHQLLPFYNVAQYNAGRGYGHAVSKQTRERISTTKRLLHGSAPQTSGVYAITDTTIGRSYIGSSTNIEQRMTVHKAELRGGYSPFSSLQEAWNTHGELAFTFTVLEKVCGKENLKAAENKWLESTMLIFNAHRYATTKGYKASDKTKAALRAARARASGTQKEVERREKISAKSKEYWSQPESRATQGRKRKGIKQSEDHKKKRLEGFNRSMAKGGHIGRSGVRGVTWDSTTKTWRARLAVSGLTVDLGRFSSVIEASNAIEEEKLRHAKNT